MKFKYYLSLNVKVLTAHLCAQLISCVIGLFTFSNIVNYGWGKIVAFVFYTGFYLVWTYSKAYKIGEKDTKSYSEHKPYPAKGFLMCPMVLAVSVIALALFFWGNTMIETNRVCYLIFVNFFRLWNFNLVPMLNINGAIGAVWYILMFILPTAAVASGYLAGMYRFELGYKFFSKLVYKDKK